MSSYERSNFWPGYLVGYLAGGLVLALPQGIARSNDKDEARERLAETQVHNEQLQEELNRSFESVTQLSLDGYEDFTFIANDGSVVEVCMGNYNATNSVAKVVGPISCSQEVAVSQG